MFRVRKLFLRLNKREFRRRKTFRIDKQFIGIKTFVYSIFSHNFKFLFLFNFILFLNEFAAQFLPGKNCFWMYNHHCWNSDHIRLILKNYTLLRILCQRRNWNKWPALHKMSNYSFSLFRDLYWQTHENSYPQQIRWCDCQ